MKTRCPNNCNGCWRCDGKGFIEEGETHMKSRGNIIHNGNELEFWIITILQIVTIILIPAGIQNIVAFIKEKRGKK
ncbi:MAG: hypothetical protein GY861_17220 [bacterium]|nr:hypothetical protein [bacterium]